MERLTAKNKHGKPIIKDWQNYMEFDIVHRLAAIEDTLGDEYDLEHLSPCTFCRFNPPSSCDGKPCCMCPAEKK